MRKLYSYIFILSKIFSVLKHYFWKLVKNLFSSFLYIFFVNNKTVNFKNVIVFLIYIDLELL